MFYISSSCLKIGSLKNSSMLIPNARHIKKIVARLTDFVLALTMFVMVLCVIVISFAILYCVIFFSLSKSLTLLATA